MQVKMEARGWSKRFRFPGYDGALPKAVRSLRGRGKYQQKVNKPPSDWGLFELLATVAGQILQDQNHNEEKAKRQYGVAKNRGFVDKSTDSINRSEEVHGIIVTSKADKDVKKPVNKEGFECAESGETQLNLGANEPFVDSKSDSNIDGSSRKCATAHEGTLSTVIESRCTFSGGTNLEILDPGYLDLQVHSEDHEESNTSCDLLFKGRLVAEEGSYMTLRDSSIQSESPPHLSSGCSEDELTSSVHTESCDILNEKTSEKHLDIRQKLVCKKTKDDDDNFLVSVVPKATSPQSSVQTSLAQELQQKKPHGLCRGETSVTGSKRKFFQTVAKDASVGSSPTSTAKAAWRKANNSIRKSHVKVNITSFTVPELSIDLPKTATVANLKRAVMDAAINLLGGGLHVRVLHQGEKVSDESATLVQMGISSRERPDSLAFMLEPDRISNGTSCIEDPLFGLSDAPNQSTAWYPVFCSSKDMDGNWGKTVNEESCVCMKMDASHNLVTGGKSNVGIEQSRGLEPQQSTPGGEASLARSGPLILHPSWNDTVATTQQTFQGMSSGKRRTRKPFTVIEVAALVQAVELLGTGRWREVKQQAFDNARHRTYVDLKDKWKTLVHTAHIAPHQRRGEPVPQELLDRVVKAHTYWAAQQAKQQAI